MKQKDVSQVRSKLKALSADLKLLIRLLAEEQTSRIKKDLREASTKNGSNH
jgi:hypothetical protein